jgi:hypothetical protein
MQIRNEKSAQLGGGSKYVQAIPGRSGRVSRRVWCVSGAGPSRVR